MSVLVLPSLAVAIVAPNAMSTPAPTHDCNYWPSTCPGVVPRSPYKQTWLMNLSTIIQPCNDSGYTDPTSTRGWGIVDFDWSNAKGTGTADGWCKHKPMDDEEMLFKQVQMTTAATPGTTVWVYRNTVYAYPWYTDIRTTLEDPAYSDWYIKFKPTGPWFSPKCDSAQPTLCSDLYHSQEQTPAYPNGDGDCAAPGCDCGKVPCGFYVWNHSSTTVVNGQTFQDWFINSYMLNEVGRSPLVSGFFWDDVWNAECNIHDQVPNTCIDMGFNCSSNVKGNMSCDDAGLVQMTADYQKNMQALREAVLSAGKFAWQMLWTGGSATGRGRLLGAACHEEALCGHPSGHVHHDKSGADPSHGVRTQWDLRQAVRPEERPRQLSAHAVSVLVARVGMG
mmetsp:Transcript_9606/g.29092  ORF Transcript_9606/g.29092 Transcript_9606/m.29092 type:complete len:392 (+) Transcript_9606:177-1352(+)